MDAWSSLWHDRGQLLFGGVRVQHATNYIVSFAPIALIGHLDAVGGASRAILAEGPQHEGGGTTREGVFGREPDGKSAGHLARRRAHRRASGHRDLPCGSLPASRHHACDW